ncbi:MAG: phosphate ABC transporter permease subunit PstC [Acidobacteria bacterium]|nr:phosphate ABC transporter permease subunit PstC [Acidobacteriota bacterium]MBK9527836.1 phosphate ABC transporter permease subunit PstC [Acidobacteriota bacterium]MBP7473795.1 phosphate ABC transporter permease subunit PstC [Pyrinomonadaceae bacterium]MBP9936928.1 phosphate ABC transporter permease subunit PstC [Pyrinomonadaceae bacterium]
MSNLPDQIEDLQPKRRFSSSDKVYRILLTGCAALILIIVITMLIVIGQGSWLSIREFGLSFLFGQVWDPVKGEFGALPFIYGTVVSSVIAVLIATPLSIGVAVFLVEQAPRSLARPIGFLVELLAAIPSVVYGLWAIFVLAPFLRVYVQPPLQATLGWLPFFKGTPTGIGMFTGGLIMAIMITPIITAVVRDILEAVPVTQREAALALGATKWETTKIVLANASSGIAGAVILGLGRAVGETMAVTMIIGNRPHISASLFDPGYTIASVIANEFTEATGDLYLSALVEMGLILFIVTFIVTALAKLLIMSVGRKTQNVA